MARGKKHTPEQIVSLLRQIEVGWPTEKPLRLLVAKAGSTSRHTTASILAG
jgi:hypothetical protein